jgi:hypothetical protein
VPLLAAFGAVRCTPGCGGTDAAAFQSLAKLLQSPQHLEKNIMPREKIQKPDKDRTPQTFPHKEAPQTPDRTDGKEPMGQRDDRSKPKFADAKASEVKGA